MKYFQLLFIHFNSPRSCLMFQFLDVHAYVAASRHTMPFIFIFHPRTSFVLSCFFIVFHFFICSGNEIIQPKNISRFRSLSSTPPLQVPQQISELLQISPIDSVCLRIVSEFLLTIHFCVRSLISTASTKLRVAPNIGVVLCICKLVQVSLSFFTRSVWSSSNQLLVSSQLPRSLSTSDYLQVSHILLQFQQGSEPENL